MTKGIFRPYTHGMNTLHTIKIAPGSWGQVQVSAGQHVRVTCPDGSQVADFWAFAKGDPSIFLSAEHTRSTLEKLVPAVGDAVYSNRRHPVLTLVEDTSPGTHDLLMSACDPRRYELLGVEGHHKSCAENLCHAMDEAGMITHELPSPFNIFQNVTVGENGELAIVPPHVQAGQYLEMVAEIDLLAIVSACPMDVAKPNGPDGKIRPILLEVSE